MDAGVGIFFCKSKTLAGGTSPSMIRAGQVGKKNTCRQRRNTSLLAGLFYPGSGILYGSSRKKSFRQGLSIKKSVADRNASLPSALSDRKQGKTNWRHDAGRTLDRRRTCRTRRWRGVPVRDRDANGANRLLHREVRNSRQKFSGYPNRCFAETGTVGLSRVKHGCFRSAGRG